MTYLGRNLVGAENYFYLFNLTVAFCLETIYKANQISVFHFQMQHSSRNGLWQGTNNQLFILHKPFIQNMKYCSTKGNVSTSLIRWHLLFVEDISINKLKESFTRRNFGTDIGQTLMQLGNELTCGNSNVKNIYALEQASLSSQNEQTFSLERDRIISVGQNKECGSEENCEIDHALLTISSSIFCHLC